MWENNVHIVSSDLSLCFMRAHMCVYEGVRTYVCVREHVLMNGWRGIAALIGAF